MTKKHAKFGSPSGLYALEKCPGKILFCKDIPDPPASPYALEGTRFHEYMETHLATALTGQEPVYFIDDLEMDRHVFDSIEAVMQKWESFRSKHTACMYYLELSVKVTADIYGTADVVFVGTNKKTKKKDIIALDYKYGAGVPVSAEENLQGIAYLLGAANTLSISHTEIGVGMVIIAQVRLEDGWSSFSIKGKDFPTYYEKILDIVGKAKEVYRGTLPLEENMLAGSHCRFCKGLSVCPVNKREHFDIVAASASDLPIEELVQQLTLDEQVAVFLKKTRIEDFLAAVAANLQKAFETGVSHPDLKLIRTNGRRGWHDDEEHVAKELEKLGATKVWNKKLVGIGDIEKQVGKNKIDKLTVLSQGKLQLARADHKSPAVDIASIQELPE